MKRSSGLVALGVSIALGGAVMSADTTQPKPIHVSEKITMKATVEAIDPTGRTVTLKGPKGNLKTFQVDESVKRFNEVKVGDEITATYFESVALEVRKAGSEPTDDSLDVAATAIPGAKPAGVAMSQTTRTVTVEAIDLATPAVTVKGADGSSKSYRVKEKKYLENVKVGDQIVVVYTEGLMIDVQAPK